MKKISLDHIVAVGFGFDKQVIPLPRRKSRVVNTDRRKVPAFEDGQDQHCVSTGREEEGGKSKEKDKDILRSI